VHSKEDAVPNVALVNLREGQALSQQEVADKLNEMAQEETGHPDSITATTVSRWERGIIDRPGSARRRRLARLFGVEVSQLGWDRRQAVPSTAPTLADELRGSELEPAADGDPHPPDERRAASQREWRQVRHGLNEHRGDLTRIAAKHHRQYARLPGSDLITRDYWMLPQPVDLADIELVWVDEPAPPELTGTERESAHVRPLVTPAQRYRRYTHAIRDLVRPGLFENRLSFRLLEVDWRPEANRLTFGPTTYFDMLDVCEAAAHELAAAHLRFTADGSQLHRPSWKRQPFRKLIGDPFNLARRPLLPSIITLTIRRTSSTPTFVLHRRDSGQVAVAGSLLHVIPTGVFQPSHISARVRAHDFDLWRNTLREYSEEFLGNLEHDGNASTPIDYDGVEPFRSLNKARRDGQLRAFCFGIGLDPLTLCGEILTAVVIDADVFDDVFHDLVASNNEGTIVLGDGKSGLGPGIAFTEDNINRLITTERMAPSGAACLQLAWLHRQTVLVA
jgi:transcriptional regulator with XRE-family HTH domain